ncbi:two component transcriptional regulator, winged helix family [Polaromonas sp. OV174]|uniref:response regulator transcription factor n=1 Tax=Polaromonas sp. OV174 TaxID=1855300 RepID=UPI0008EC54FF|nr:response regulator transcription factor [Polaromonas sp. OV174]SFC43607.1 two component transcriptional regulator, winged helix family [Polaromonas sp. OV174]
MTPTLKLLLIEDDASMQTALQRALSRRGMEVVGCTDGRQAVAQWSTAQPDVVVLDLSLPGLDGLQVLELARRQGLLTPVLILTARGTVGDRIMGLNLGADDYLPKPFDLDELEARLRALSRRRAAPSTETGPSQQLVGDLRYEKESGAIYHRDQVLELTPRELALLQTLIVKPGHAVSKERLFELVFPGETDVQYEAVEVVVYRLRKKLSHTGVTLVTLRGLGYLLKVDA